MVMTKPQGLGINLEPGHKCRDAGVTGKTVRIFLPGGEPAGTLLAEILIAGAWLKRRASLMAPSLGERIIGG